MSAFVKIIRTQSVKYHMRFLTI